jgi:hypothetical protein
MEDNFKKSKRTHDEAQLLSNRIQEDLHRLQHPVDCQNAKKILCTENIESSFGSRMHRIFTYCLFVAYRLNRTLLTPLIWNYNQKNAVYQSIFMPWSPTCGNLSLSDAVVSTGRGKAIGVKNFSFVPRTSVSPVKISIGKRQPTSFRWLLALRLIKTLCFYS